MEEEIKQLSIYRFEKSNHSLLLAKKLLEDGEFSYSQNRAYYALFEAMRAIIALDKFDSSKHSGIIAYFNQNYVKTEIFNKETSKIIRKVSLLREKSDYEDFYEATQDDTNELICEVEVFINDVRKYLIQEKVIENDN